MSSGPIPFGSPMVMATVGFPIYWLFLSWVGVASHPCNVGMWYVTSAMWVSGVLPHGVSIQSPTPAVRAYCDLSLQ